MTAKKIKLAKKAPKLPTVVKYKCRAIKIDGVGDFFLGGNFLNGSAITLIFEGSGFGYPTCEITTENGDVFRYHGLNYSVAFVQDLPIPTEQ